MFKRPFAEYRSYALYVVWFVALVSMLGSLYFQYIMKFPPCVLCWYQRVAVYPLAIIVPVGIVIKDKSVALYAAILSGLGLLVAVYHNLLYYQLLPEAAASCIQGFSCTTKFIEWFGFITIPLLSLVALTIIFIASLFAWKGRMYE